MSDPAFALYIGDTIKNADAISKMNWQIVVDTTDPDTIADLTDEQKGFIMGDSYVGDTYYGRLNHENRAVANLFVTHSTTYQFFDEPCMSVSICNFYVSASQRHHKYGYNLLANVMQEEEQNAWNKHYNHVRFTLKLQLGNANEEFLAKYYAKLGFELCKKNYTALIENRIMYRVVTRPPDAASV